jgi:hypothetical protein
MFSASLFYFNVLGADPSVLDGVPTVPYYCFEIDPVLSVHCEPCQDVLANLKVNAYLMTDQAFTAGELAAYLRHAIHLVRSFAVQMDPHYRRVTAGFNPLKQMQLIVSNALEILRTIYLREHGRRITQNTCCFPILVDALQMLGWKADPYSHNLAAHEIENWDSEFNGGL